MKTKCILSFLVFLLGIGYQATNAVAIVAAIQTPDPWRVTVFDRKTGQLHYLTPSGIEPGPVVPVPETAAIRDVRLAPDGHYLVYNDYDNHVWVADLVAGTCCIELTSSDPGHIATRISPISPDSTKIAVSMTSMAFFDNPDGIDLPVMVFDLASGQLSAALSIKELQSAGFQASAAQFGDWLADGLRVYPSWWFGEPWGELSGTYQIWDPAAGTLSGPVEPFDLRAQELPGTGEMLKAVAHPEYPQSGIPTPYVNASNVVEYFPSANATEGSVVFFDPSHVFVYNAAWVANGQAFVADLVGELHSSADKFDITFGQSFMVFRDGHQVPVFMMGYIVLTGTPDGWIAQSLPTGDAYIVQLLPDDKINLTEASAGDSNDWVVLDTNFQLGVGITASPFPAAVPPPAFATCPGFMTSRLWPNTYAAVVSGASVDLRSAPSSSGTLLGTLPGLEMFAVIEGPTCAENTAWWQVEHKGTTGWLAEGQGNTYWLAPIVLAY